MAGALWWWAKRAMFAAAVASLALYVTVMALEAIVDATVVDRRMATRLLSGDVPDVLQEVQCLGCRAG